MNWDEWVAEQGYAPLLEQIRKDSGDAPCCHWGTSDWNWERFALLYVVALCGAGSGEDPNDLDPDVLDGMIGSVISDGHGGLAGSLISYRSELPEGWEDWADVEDFLDDDPTLIAVCSALRLAASKMWFALRAEGLADRETLNPWAAAYPVLWSEVFDYWDVKEG